MVQKHNKRTNALLFAPDHNNTTASAIRKKHAYSWYAPLYGSLEEDIVRDTDVPLHNLSAQSYGTVASPGERELLTCEERDIEISKKDENLMQDIEDRKDYVINASYQQSKKRGGTVRSTVDYLDIDINGNREKGIYARGDATDKRKHDTASRSQISTKPEEQSMQMQPKSTTMASSIAIKPKNRTNSESTTASATETIPTTTRSRANTDFLYTSIPRTIVSPPPENVYRAKHLTGRFSSEINCTIQQKLHHILRRGGSSTSLRHEKTQSMVHYKSLRKCETVLVLTRQHCNANETTATNAATNNTNTLQVKKNPNLLSVGSVEKIRPLNRWRHSANSMSGMSSRCSSHTSLLNKSQNVLSCSSSANFGETSKKSSNVCLHVSNRHIGNSTEIRNYSNQKSPSSSTIDPILPTSTHSFISVLSNDEKKKLNSFQPFVCKMCLADIEAETKATVLLQCNCQFCTECLRAYVDFEISEGAYDISCPDAQCPVQGSLTLPEVTHLTTASLIKKHHRYRLNREIELDKWRAWCPRAGCETICYVEGESNSSSDLTSPTSNSNEVKSKFSDKNKKPIPVQCPTCNEKFCLVCRKAWHPKKRCKENGRLLSDDLDDIGITFGNDVIKGCPMCGVLIEKDDGCAQMMCKRCKHVFCWYCLASLDDDFLLRHYDKGPCKNKLGHSRASVIWHRAQVIGIFAGFGILLLIASPLLLLAAPCIICCKCRSCGDIHRNEEKDDIDEEQPALQS